MSGHLGRYPPSQRVTECRNLNAHDTSIKSPPHRRATICLAATLRAYLHPFAAVHSGRRSAHGHGDHAHPTIAVEQRTRLPLQQV
jgi:hypothetical protein